MSPRKTAVAAKAKMAGKRRAEETVNLPLKRAKSLQKKGPAKKQGPKKKLPQKKVLQKTASQKKASLQKAQDTPSKSPGSVGPVAAKPIINTAPTAQLDVFVFGEGGAGELGLGVKNTVNVKTPRLNVNLHAETVGVVDISTGGMHAVALTHDNQVLTWGINDNRALGRDTAWEGRMKDIKEEDETASEDSAVDLNPAESTPAAVLGHKFPPGTNFVRVAAADSSTFALTEDGYVYGWGTFLVSMHFPLQGIESIADSPRTMKETMAFH